MQRCALFADTLRQRGNTWQEQASSAGAACPQLRCGAHPGRAYTSAARQLPPGAHQGAERGRHRPDQAALHRVRPPRRTWPGHRRHEAGQRDRRRAARPAIPATSSASCRSRSPGRPSRMSASPRPRSSRRSSRCEPEAEGKPCLDRQLPGRLADHADRGDAARSGRTDHPGRFAAVLLGRRPRQEPDALSRRPARRHLADGARRRSRRRHLRRRQPRRQFRDA